ncbi:MAG: Protein tyrosine/serine phosphatase, partial [bacterium]
FKPSPNKDEIKEEREQATKANMKFEHVPMHPIWPPKEEQIDRVLALIRDQNNWPIYIHCEHGVNRTGLIIATYRVKVEGWTPQQAYNEMVRLGFRRYLFWWEKAFFEYANKK